MCPWSWASSCLERHWSSRRTCSSTSPMASSIRASSTSEGDPMSHARPASGSRPVHEIAIRRLRIPMRDGVRLFATAWHPDGDGPFPVVINYDPYRSADARTLGRGNWFHYLARHGYVVLQLDVHSA